MSTPHLGDCRFAKSERGYYDDWQIWNGTDWVSITYPRCPEEPVSSDLSAAASAVRDAAGEAFDEWDFTAPVVAALRAAALYCKRDRLQLLAIASELEADAA